MIRSIVSFFSVTQAVLLGGAVLLAASLLPSASPAAALLVPTGCYAGNPTGNGATNFSQTGNFCSAPVQTTGGDRWDTTAYIGLSFSIGGDGFKPHLTGGVRETDINASNTVLGAEANASISLVDWLKDAQVRVLALAGNTDVLGNGGVGWDIGKHSFLLNAGAQVPYVRAFVDYTIDDKALRAFLEINSYGRIDAVQHGIACGAGTVLASAPQILSNWGNALGATDVVGDIFAGSLYYFGTQTFAGSPSTTSFVNGQTCYTQGTPRPPA